ncbi:hypothetical protein Tco_0212179 [Tanacetum coccineum]
MTANLVAANSVTKETANSVTKETANSVIKETANSVAANSVTKETANSVMLIRLPKKLLIRNIGIPHSYHEGRLLRVRTIGLRMIDLYRDALMLPPFYNGVPPLDDDIVETTYLHSDHNEGLWIQRSSATRKWDKIRLQGCWTRPPGDQGKIISCWKKEGIRKCGCDERKVAVDDFDALVNKVTLNVLAAIPTLQPDSRTCWLVQSTCASGGSYDEFNEIEACELIVEWFRTYQIVAKGQVYPSRDGMLYLSSREYKVFRCRILEQKVRVSGSLVHGDLVKLGLYSRCFSIKVRVSIKKLLCESLMVFIRHHDHFIKATGDKRIITAGNDGCILLLLKIIVMIDVQIRVLVFVFIQQHVDGSLHLHRMFYTSHVNLLFVDGLSL